MQSFWRLIIKGPISTLLILNLLNLAIKSVSKSLRQTPWSYLSTMIATVLDQPSPLRAVEHPKSKTVYYGARASNICADPRIAVIDKDCISLQKATDNPCAWKERLSLNTANSLSVFLKVADIPPRTNLSYRTFSLGSDLVCWSDRPKSNELLTCPSQTKRTCGKDRLSVQTRMTSY